MVFKRQPQATNLHLALDVSGKGRETRNPSKFRRLAYVTFYLFEKYGSRSNVCQDDISLQRPKVERLLDSVRNTRGIFFTSLVLALEHIDASGCRSYGSLM